MPAKTFHDNRVLRTGAVLLASGLLFSVMQQTALAATMCCSCNLGAGVPLRVSFTTVQNCLSIVQSTEVASAIASHPDLQALTCTGRLPDEQCATGGSTPVVPSGDSSPPRVVTFAELTAGPAAGSPSALAQPAINSALGAPFVPIVPHLNVAIPGLTFTPASKGGNTVTIPYLSQYIAAVYRYLIGLSVIAAIIMVTYGGFQYMIGSTTGGVQRGKEIIQDAIIGLVLVLGGYLILYTVNPETLTLGALNLPVVNEVPFNPQGDTGAGLTSAIPGVTSGPTTRTDMHVYTDCPVTLTSGPATLGPRTNDQLSDRTIEFWSKMVPLVSSLGTRACVIRTAEAAVRCGVLMGSCLDTQSGINRFCGANGSSTDGQGNEHNSSGAISNSVMGKTARTCPAETHGNWMTCNRVLIDQAYADIQTRFPGVMDGWASGDQLKPGDGIWIYNANDGDPRGAHSAIFMGWADTNGHARLIGGGQGDVVKESGSPPCLKSTCSRPYPILKTYAVPETQTNPRAYQVPQGTAGSVQLPGRGSRAYIVVGR